MCYERNNTVQFTSSERELRIAGHGVRLVEDDQLQAGAEQLLRAGKLLDLLANHVNAAVVRGVELKQGSRTRVNAPICAHLPQTDFRFKHTHLEHHGREIVAIHLPCARKNGGGFAGSRRAVEQQVRQLVGLDQPIHCTTANQVSADNATTQQHKAKKRCTHRQQ